jgi:hypothetical protein
MIGTNINHGISRPIQKLITLPPVPTLVSAKLLYTFQYQAAHEGERKPAHDNHSSGQEEHAHTEMPEALHHAEVLTA